MHSSVLTGQTGSNVQLAVILAEVRPDLPLLHRSPHCLAQPQTPRVWILCFWGCSTVLTPPACSFWRKKIINSYINSSSRQFLIPFISRETYKPCHVKCMTAVSNITSTKAYGGYSFRSESSTYFSSKWHRDLFLFQPFPVTVLPYAVTKCCCCSFVLLRDHSLRLQPGFQRLPAVPSTLTSAHAAAFSSPPVRDVQSSSFFSFCLVLMWKLLSSVRETERRVLLIKRPLSSHFLLNCLHLACLSDLGHDSMGFFHIEDLLPVWNS